MSRKGIQLAYPFEEKRLTKWKPPYIVQPKYDGERCRAIPLGEGKYMLLSSEENPIFSVPHIIKDLSKLGTDVELDGELYCHGMDFDSIHSRVSRTVNLHSGREVIKFHVFDIVDDDSQTVRLYNLTNIVPQKSNLSITRAPFYICHSLEDIMRVYDLLLNKGYEGIIVRHLEAPYVRKRSIYMMKFKPKKEDVYKIVGYKQMVDKNGNLKNLLGALVLTSDEGTQFSVGSGMTEDFRRKNWLNMELVGKYCKVQYQHLTAGRGVPRFPVFLEVIE